MAKRNRAAVIGAGLCGLGSIKSLKEEDFDVVCFEKTGYCGGLWRYHDDDSDGVASVMKTTIINTSKEMGAISDFPPPADYPNYMHNSMMYEYIKTSLEKFDGMRYIKFHHETQKIEKTDDYEETGRWKVTCKNTETGEIVSDVFDCVAVCIGHHVYPNIPTFPGQKDFTGKIMHSHSLKTAKGFEDMRIIVVGVGNSGMDAAVELSSVAKQVYLSSRRGTWVLPKIGPGGLPLDATFLRRPSYLMLKYLPYNLVCTISEMFINSSLDHSLYNLKPKHRIWSQHPTASDILPIKLLSGVVVTRGNIKTFTKNGVIFENEEEETPVDAAILCTGYKVKFDFLSEDILSVKDNRVQLYKYIFPPDLPHPTLAILGLIQPNGPGIPVGEMQARWASAVMRGKISLPSKEKMYADIKKKDDYNRKRFTNSSRHTFQVEFIGYQDELAEEIGVKPNLLKLAITDPKLFLRVFFGPSLSYQYRLQGPHSWEGARNAILTYNERVRAPLLRPGQKLVKKEKGLFNLSTIVKIFFLLPLILFFFLTTVSFVF